MSMFRFHWESTGLFESEATIIWDITKDQSPGIYRIVYYLDHKELGGTIIAADGTSQVFTVAEPGFNKPIETKLEKYLRKYSKIGRQHENDVLKGKGRNYFNSLVSKKQG